MNLKELIEYLEKKDRDLIVPMGFADPHSYRGDYECVAFEPVESITIGAMLDYARDAMGSIYQGWKGGEYRMGRNTEVYLAMEGQSGEKMGRILLNYMTGVYEEEESFKYRKQIVEQSKIIYDLTGEKNDLGADLVSADRIINKLIVEKDNIGKQLTAANQGIMTLRGAIKEDQRRIASLSEERTTLDRWFLNDRDTLRSIERICAELEMCDPEHIRRDVQAIKSMSMVSDIMKDWDPSIGRAKESEGWNKNGEDILSVAIDEISKIERCNLKTINDLLRAHIEELKGTISDQNKEINELEHRNENQMESIQYQRNVLKSSARLDLRQDDEITALEGIVKKQNQTILHVNAELEATKQYDPFDLVLIAGSMENISDIIKDHLNTSEPVIDEKDKTIGKCLRRIDEHLQDKARMTQDIEGLEAELAVLKGDSAVLMKVVNIVRDWGFKKSECEIHRDTIGKIFDEVEDYIDDPDIIVVIE